MGDRAQVAIKRGEEKVYLYGHWIGAEIYTAVGRALKEVPGRHSDSDYLARAVFCRMVPQEDWAEETGFGIGASRHGDIEHPIPILDCGTQTVTFEPANYGKKDGFGDPLPFAEFADKALAGEFQDW